MGDGDEPKVARGTAGCGSLRDGGKQGLRIFSPVMWFRPATLPVPGVSITAAGLYLI